MGPRSFATRRSIFPSPGRARRLLPWPLLLAALAACAPDPEPVGTALQAATVTAPPMPPDAACPAAPIVAPLPREPAIRRDVHLIEQANQATQANPYAPSGAVDYTHPIIPPFRTSADGRIGVDLASHRLFLLGPEALDEPITDPVWDGNLDGADTAPVIVLDQVEPSADSTFYVTSAFTSPTGKAAEIDLKHQTICDATPQFGYATDTKLNPHPCDPTNVMYPDPANSLPEQDCYNLTMISVVEIHEGPCTTSGDCIAPLTCDQATLKCSSGVQLWSKAFTAVVTDPKRSGILPAPKPELEVVPSSAPATPGTVFHADVAHDLSVTSDGRLLVTKLSKSRRNPNDGSGRGQLDSLDIVYSTYSEGFSPCDVTKWKKLYPISHAHVDPNMVGRYGIADHQLRDPQGHFVEDGEDLRVSYPWMDRAGDNLFFTSLQATLFSEVQSGGPIKARYREECLSDDIPCKPDPTDLVELRDFEETENFRGVGVVGQWTHGKMVLDSAINNIDYGLGRTQAEQRLLELYTDAAGASSWVRAGTGKYPGGPAPAFSTGNISFIDSLEHLFNWNENMRPLTLRDVVWILNTGKNSAELVFDDYLDPNALIVAEMSGALEHTDGGDVQSRESLRYYDGFNQVGPGRTDCVDRPVRFQNAATSRGWKLPAFGAAHGDVRLEPVALGGVEGKGAWLDGAGDRISFEIPDQAPAKAIADHAFYLGVFVDPRFTDDGVVRQLFTFGSGDQIVLVGRSKVEYLSHLGTTLHSINIASQLHPIDVTGPDPLQKRGQFDQTPAPGAWSHLAFVLDYPQNRTVLYVNGFSKGFTDGVFPLVGTANVGAGVLHVGDAPNDSTPGFKGWIDDVKLLAYRPTPELACNHARGTLMMVGDKSGPWLTLAQSHPQLVHDAISVAAGLSPGPFNPGPRYVCYHKYRDHRLANPRFVPAHLGLTSIREHLNFPEGPLELGVERPGSSDNKFCKTCHHDLGMDGLGLEALDPGSVLLQHDERRQPMMPPRRMFGNVPAGLFGSGPPSDLSTRHHAIDQYVFPSPPPP
jgi:hypothetical protein